MYLSVSQVSPAFQGTIKVKKAEVLKKGNIVEAINDLVIDAKDIKRIDSVCVDAEAFAQELGLPNKKRVFSSFKESVEKACNEISLVTLYNDVKYKIGVAKDKFLEAYGSVFDTDSEITL